MTDVQDVLQIKSRRSSREGEGKGDGSITLMAWMRKLSQKLWRPDEESYICYALFVILFVADVSILALVLQIALFCYALLAQHPARLFWQVGVSVIRASK